MGSEYWDAVVKKMRQDRDVWARVVSFINSCKVDESFEEKIPEHFNYDHLHHCYVLSLAVARRKRGMVKWLLSKGADPNDTRDFGQTQLIRYTSITRQDDISIPLILLDSRAELDAVDLCGQTALHHCAAGGLLKIARLLIDRGATVDIKDGRGSTPLDCVDLRAAGAAVAREMHRLLMDSRTSQLFSKVVAGGLASSMSFLCEGVYDPRLLIHIANFAFVEDVVYKRKF